MNKRFALIYTITGIVFSISLCGLFFSIFFAIWFDNVLGGKFAATSMTAGLFVTIIAGLCKIIENKD